MAEITSLQWKLRLNPTKEEGATMYARTIQAAIVPGQTDEAIRVYNEQVLPLIRQQPGLISSALMIDRDNSRAMTVTVWETAEALAATAEGTSYLQQALGLLRGLVAPQGFAHWEVASST